MVTATAALAAAVPAIAKTHPSHPSHPSHPATSNRSSGTSSSSTTSSKCTLHNVAYIASGTVATWAATQTGTNNTWDGAISITVTRANHHAKQNPMGGSYMLTNARVRLGKGVTNPPAAGDRVVLIGKITEAAKKCGSVTGAGVVTVRKVDVKTPKTHP
jgi:hypothetical protein